MSRLFLAAAALLCVVGNAQYLSGRPGPPTDTPHPGGSLNPTRTPMTFQEAFKEMPEYPKMVIFLPKGTGKDAIEFTWHEGLTKKAGSRMIVLSLVNNTKLESETMAIFGLKDENDLPAVKVIKPSSGPEGTPEAYQGNVNSNLWSYDNLAQLMEESWLSIKTNIPTETTPLLGQWQVSTEREFYNACIQGKTGRCAIYLMNMDKKKEHLDYFVKGMAGFRSVFYEFHPIWADIRLAKSVFKFPEIDQHLSPQIVLLDTKDKVFAPRQVTGAADIVHTLQIFDQPNAMQKIKSSMHNGRSPLSTNNIPKPGSAAKCTSAGSHEEL